MKAMPKGELTHALQSAIHERDVARNQLVHLATENLSLKSRAEFAEKMAEALTTRPVPYSGNGDDLGQYNFPQWQAQLEGSELESDPEEETEPEPTLMDRIDEVFGRGLTPEEMQRRGEAFEAEQALQAADGN